MSVREAHVRFGGIVALDGITFDLRSGEILGLIGPNGAGKTTLFNCLSRLYTPGAGAIEFEGRSILALSRHEIARIGIGRTFQNLALFRGLTVIDNVMVGGHVHASGNLLVDALGLPMARTSDAALRAEASELIAYLGLREVAHEPVLGLPYGTQKRVELARALAARPKLLLLDEPAGGLNHEEVGELGRLIRQIRDDRRTTVLLVEHHMGLVMSISDRVVALDFGRKIAEGSPAAVQQDRRVIQAYLGQGKA